ncbi:MarR family winged helix-turn-helix transcriptional regulator [Methylobacterium sp. J-068]|uniref:MarR family winged helix-turn-helix transcriptional regulator n=1 Tax=Methylobacterium sp. J-068 TaxID=2836649 RepID=UPI001FB9AE88|nr:MarR family winged helix-turn-helix transcriptional regulator [Methylobacterium sp. J-068]MCJ2034809.1 MarR family winged helix-turn-helix transcriptional regulator [Methylobacterium sp. J-068]
MAELSPRSVTCHCNAIRQGARQVTQFYDRHLAPAGLRTSQYSMLVGLRRLGPISINGFADAMAMDRTTMGRALKPLERDGLLAVGPGPNGRTRALDLTEAGRRRITEAEPLWRTAQTAFEARYGAADAARLCDALARVVQAV